MRASGPGSWPLQRTSSPVGSTQVIEPCRQLSAQTRTAVRKIAGVLRNSPADRGGIRPGDVLIAVDGQTVRDPKEMLDRVAALQPGRTAGFRVRRAGEEMDLKVEVGQRPQPGGR